MEKETILQTYIDHYKDSYELVKNAQAGRNKSFVGLCILEAISFLLIINPDLIYGLLKETISEKLETTVLLGNAILQSFIWVLIAYVLIRYIQFTMYIERQYSYLDKLEGKVQEVMGKDSIFDREGANYLRDYPIVLNLIDLFYKMFCPIFFACVNTVHINLEWRDASVVGLALVVDTIIYVVIILLIWFYFFEIHDKISKWCKEHIIGVRWISEKLHKILKYV